MIAGRQSDVEWYEEIFHCENAALYLRKTEIFNGLDAYGTERYTVVTISTHFLCVSTDGEMRTSNETWVEER